MAAVQNYLEDGTWNYYRLQYHVIIPKHIWKNVLSHFLLVEKRLKFWLLMTVRRTVPQRLLTAMPKSIRRSWRQSIRKTGDMVRPWIQELQMPQACILRWLTAMTGLRKRYTGRFLQSSMSLPAVRPHWICWSATLFMKRLVRSIRRWCVIVMHSRWTRCLPGMMCIISIKDSIFSCIPWFSVRSC